MGKAINKIMNLTENQFFFQATMIVLTRPAISTCSTFNVVVTFCKTTVASCLLETKTVTHIYQKEQCS